MLKKVSDLFAMVKSSTRTGIYYVHPIYNRDKNVFDMFEAKSAAELHEEIVYVYVCYESQESFFRGSMSSCHKNWFIMQEIPLNNLETLDYLYSVNRQEEMEHINSIGVIYKYINNDTSK